MSTTVFIAVIAAAILHATWNALVKGGADKLLAMTAVVLGHAPFGLAAMALSPLPDAASLPYIAAGIALHAGYQLFLLAAYRIGDLTQVYPIARGIAPLIVALVSVALLGVTLLPLEQVAVLVIGLGIMSLSLVRQHEGSRNPRASLFALGTGCFIAGYSLVDGLGARAAGTPLGYYGWVTVGNALVFAVAVSPRRPALMGDLARTGKRLFFVGGGASFAAYALVVWAFTEAPIALVTALRETSIVFALLIGVGLLGERLSLTKLLSTFATLAGAALLRFARA